MDQVFAKIKGLRKKPYFKVISDYGLFENVDVDVSDCVVYAPDHNLDDDSFFKIEKFSEKKYCLDFLKGDFDSKEYDDLKKEQFSKIAYLISVQDKNFYFQKITPSLFIKRKTIVFGDAAEVEQSENRLIVNSRPDAVYIKSGDVLIFRNLASISSIFRGIDELFKEATNQEVDKFLNESFLELGGGFSVDKVSKPNRKRLALAIDTLEDMSSADKDDMLSYVQDYCDKKLKFDKNKKFFEISSDRELKLLLYGIEQRFYTTPFGKEKRLANSVENFD